MLFYWTVLALVFVGTAVGSYALVPAVHSAAVAQAVRENPWMSHLKFLLDVNPVLLMLGIWVKNTLVALILLLLGGYLSGFFSYVIIVFNALIVGVLSKYLVASGASWYYVLAGLLPHSVIELPAIFLAGAIAIYAVQRRLPFSRRLLGGLGRVAPLLLIAAAVETYVTPLIMIHFR